MVQSEFSATLIMNQTCFSSWSRPCLYAILSRHSPAQVVFFADDGGGTGLSSEQQAADFVNEVTERDDRLLQSTTPLPPLERAADKPATLMVLDEVQVILHP